MAEDKKDIKISFCGYNKNSKIATLSLNTTNNKYCCSRCGAGRIFSRIICSC